MTPEIAVLGIALGLLFSLVCYLLTNLSPGGMVTPGWLALLLIDSAARALVLGCVVVLTYGLVRLLRRVVILYGKRLFSAVVMVAVFLQIGCLLLFLGVLPLSVLPSLHAQLVDTATLGFIVPGLLAYQFLRQPVLPTLVAVSSVTVLTYAIMLAGVLLRLFPGSGSGEAAAETAASFHVAASSFAAAGALAALGVGILLWRSARLRRNLVLPPR